MGTTRSGRDINEVLSKVKEGGGGQAPTIAEIRQRGYMGSSAPSTPQNSSTDTSFAPAPPSASVDSSSTATAGGNTPAPLAGGEMAQADGGETDTPTRTPVDPDTDPEADKTGLPPAAMAARTGGAAGGLPPMGAGSGEWLSDMIRAMWPYVTVAVTKMAQASLPPLIDASIPKWVGGMKLTKFRLGGDPPTLTNIRVKKELGEGQLADDDLIYIEADFDWVSDQDVEMDITPLPAKSSFVPNMVMGAISKATSFRAGVEDFWMHGQIRITMRPMLEIVPVIAAIQVSLIENPNFDFTITYGSGDHELKLFPAMKAWMYSFITDNLLASYVLPDHYFYPMVPNAPDYNIPVGILEVTVVECKNVPKMDWMGGSDTYVELTTHKKGAAQTNLKNGKEAVWNETYTLPVHVKEHQCLTAIMYDHDEVGSDDEIGRAVVRLANLRVNEVADMWVPVKPLMEHEGGEDKKQSTPQSTAEKIGHKLTKPLQPPNPSEKGTELHLRIQYRDMTVEQTKEVLNSQRTGQPIRDQRLAKLLEEAAPVGGPPADFSAKVAPGDETPQKAAVGK